MAAQPTIINKVKAWAAPVLLTGFSFILWQDISEMKTDVKKLVSESEYRRAKEEQMERDITDLKNAVYFGKKSVTSFDMNGKSEKPETRIPIYFINRENFRFKRNGKPVVAG